MLLFKILLCSILFCTYSVHSLSAIDLKREYHLPYTDAESKAAQIVHLAAGYVPDFFNNDDWDVLVNYIKTFPHKNPKTPLQYTNYFTKDFIYGWSEVEYAEVKESCDGKYIEGELCGINMAVLTCSQDGGGIYLYRTLEETENHAIIDVLCYSNWPKYGEAVKADYDLKNLDTERTRKIVLYKLIKLKERWLLDGLICSNNPTKQPYFHINFPKFTPTNAKVCSKDGDKF